MLTTVVKNRSESVKPVWREA